jgi:large subunit ribosomal protein L4
MPTVSVVDQKGAVTATLELKPEVFGAAPRVPLLHQAVVKELASRRAGTHDTKTRAEVSGGGRKPWRQKGTGRARQGTIRAAQWRKGGIVFGPHPRSYEQSMPQKARREALREALSDKVSGGQLVVVERIGVTEPKTKALIAYLAGLGITGTRTLILVADQTDKLVKASRNVPWLFVETPAHLSVYQLLRVERVLAERPALLTLEKALAP